MTTAESLMPPAAACAPPVHTPLNERMLHASNRTVFTYGCTLLLPLASSLVLTRLLVPETFGLIAIVSTILTVASSLLYMLADKLLLGEWVMPAVLGCFAIGQTLAQILELAVGRVFSQVASPAFADVMRNSPQRLREVYLRMRLQLLR
jgi:O-antigen/teichoic acid export membrane protein